MNLRDLQYIVFVAEHRHFGKAAEICNVSQPSLSMQIKKLEETLGVQIFERTNKHVMVTNAGNEIIARAKKILREAEEIKIYAKSHGDPFSGEIRLGAFPTLSPYFFPKIIPKIRKSLPALKLLLIEEKTDSLVSKIIHGEIDAAFLSLPLENYELEEQFLFDDKFMLAVSATHPLAKKKKVSPSDFISENLLLLEDGHCLSNQAIEFCHTIKNGNQEDFRATSLETLRQMVASGNGITLMPLIATNKQRDIKYLPLTEPSPSRAIGLVWRKTSARGECFRRVAEIVGRVY